MNFTDYPYFLITSNNRHEAGFRSVAFAGTHQVQIEEIKKGSKDKIAFVNYDYKNENGEFPIKKNNPLNFLETLFIEIEKEFSADIFFNEPLIPAEKINVKATVSKEEYIKKVNHLKQHIQQGNIYEINYCITFEATDVKINPLSLYERLNSISEASYSALAKFNNQYIISSSPELFLSKKGNKLITKPIKGTARRGKTQEEDLKIKTDLQSSLKERTENVMIVDVCRNDLSRIATIGSVKVEKLYDIESYLQVHQMVSTISCELKDDVTFSEIIDATFPMASMTGAPKIRAMELIDEYELYNRGPYSGCLGYIKPNGDFDLSVLIRSVFYDEEKQYLSFTVGSAITHLCDPEQEYEECLLKANAMLKALNAEIIN